MPARIAAALATLACSTFATAPALADTGGPTGPRLPPIIHRGVNLPAPSQSKPVPLVIGLHGSSMTPGSFEHMSGLDRVADQYGFVVAYLGSQTPTSSAWTLSNMQSNLTYISSEITQLTASENIDPARVYVTGFSAGASMAFSVGCALSNRVAAIAPVSGWMRYSQACRLTRPEAMMLIIGTHDAVPSTGTAKLMSASGMASRWANLDGCSPTPASATTFATVTQSVWGQCNDASGVGLDLIQGGTHSWPPNGRADRYLNAGQAIWAFFAAHPAMSATAPSVSVTSQSVGHHRGHRWTRIALTVDENTLGLRASLSYRGHRIAYKTFNLRRGQQVDLVSLRTKAPAGRYKLTLVFTDTYGRMETIVRTVKVPKLPKPPKKH